jgi:DNA-binding transcriptional LysR family regulator
LNILKIKYFVDVANLKSFTKAAQSNYVSQTAVSQQIASIEKELDVQLFERTKGKVELTPAGRSFYQDCIKFLQEYECAVSKAKKISNENNGTISIGFLTATKMGYLYDVIKKFHENYPNVKVKLVQGSFSSLRRQLENRELDIGLAIRYNLEDIETIQLESLMKMKMGLLVSRKNPLAQRREILAAEVKKEPIVMISRQFAGKVYDHMVQQRRKEGYEPNIVETADSSEILTMLVEMNRGSAFLPEKFAIYNEAQCKILHIVDNDDYAEYTIAWQKDNSSQSLHYMVSCIKDFFKNEFEEWADRNRNKL